MSLWWQQLALVAGGGALGAMLRFWVGGWLLRQLGDGLPWGTLTVNLAGSALIGALAALADSGRVALPSEVRLFLMVGLLGGFTTFSAFSLQTVGLLRAGDFTAAGLNVVLSVMLCLAATFAGHLVAMRTV